MVRQYTYRYAKLKKTRRLPWKFTNLTLYLGRGFADSIKAALIPQAKVVHIHPADYEAMKVLEQLRRAS